ncbi:MAG: hypothetical protein O7G88_20000 [bacterium]|nr:hypothetical protein [bacterium]
MVGSVSSLAIPTTLHDSLIADRLESAKGIAQLGAVIGRQFTYVLLDAVSQLDEVPLQHELAQLVETELAYQRGLPISSSRRSFRMLPTSHYYGRLGSATTGGLPRC